MVDNYDYRRFVAYECQYGASVAGSVFDVKFEISRNLFQRILKFT